MNDSRDFQDAESVRSGHSHVASQLVSFPLFPDPGEMPSRSSGMSSRQNGRQAFGTRTVHRETIFANPVASSSALYPQELKSWSSRTEEPLHSSTVEQSERQTQDQDQRCQFGPSARNSVSSLVREILQRIMGQTDNDCRFWIFTLTSSLRQQPLLAGR